MNDVGVINGFLDVFSRYIDSGFGLLRGEVGFLSTTLIAIDVTIAGLFWAWGADEDVLQRLIRKTLSIGFFAFLIGNFATLATILFQSFAGLGLKAGGGRLSLEAFLQPGTIAAVGLDAGEPLLRAAGELMGFTAFFANFVQIAVLMLAWVIVILAFFVLAVQLFVTLIEFKLVTLAGFILLPFAFFGRTAFMAERVLGHIVSSGIKVLVLGVITGIGTGLFDQFTTAPDGLPPTAEQCLSIALASLSLLGLGIFGPGIANGIVTGGPQLGAGSAAGTALAAGAAIGGGIAGTRLAAGAVGNMAMAAAPSGTSSASTGSAGMSGGHSSDKGGTAGGVTASPLRSTPGAGDRAAGSSEPSTAVPGWASAMRRRQAFTHGVATASQTLRGGDSHGGGASVDLGEKD
jgi:type IV secretion system protein TrbL